MADSIKSVPDPPSSPPDDPNGDDPRMLTLLRDGREIACVTGSDGPDACFEGAILLLRQRYLRIGDQLIVTRI